MIESSLSSRREAVGGLVGRGPGAAVRVQAPQGILTSASGKWKVQAASRSFRWLLRHDLELLPERLDYSKDFNAYLRIQEDGRVGCLVGKVELGQGNMTALAMILAEELDVALDRPSLAFSKRESGFPAFVIPLGRQDPHTMEIRPNSESRE